MLSELRQRCPHLSPTIIPRGFTDSEKSTALLALCRDTAERQSLTETLSRARVATDGRCALTGQQLGADELHIVSMWVVDPERHAFCIQGLVVVCKQVALLMQVRYLLERFTRGTADTTELTELAIFFCRVNGEISRCDDPFEARLWLQECVNLAYACMVLASSLGAWQVLGPADQSLDGTVSTADLADTMFRGGAQPDTSITENRHTAPGSKGTRSSGKKRART